MWRVRSVLSASLAMLLSFSLGPTRAEADPGIGVSLGQIQIEDRLLPGESYTLPTLSVINTGNQAAEYEVSINYLQDQTQQRPPPRWFDFQPQRFHLDGGKAQNVQIKLTMPTGALPGSYLAFIEAGPISQGTGVKIGIAA